MRAGDLVYVYSQCGSSSPRTLTITVTGGQTWNTSELRNGDTLGLPFIWISWCTFNGTWSANPAFVISGTAVSKLRSMHVFRAPKAGAVWAIDQGPHQTVEPDVEIHVLPSITNTKKCVSIFGGAIPGVRTGTSGAGWLQLGAAQYAHEGPNPQYTKLAYQVMGYGWPVGIPVGATGNCTITCETTSFAFLTRISFYITN